MKNLQEKQTGSLKRNEATKKKAEGSPETTSPAKNLQHNITPAITQSNKKPPAPPPINMMNVNH